MSDPAGATPAKTENLTFYTGDELYDWIMRGINPKLTTKNLGEFGKRKNAPLTAEESAQYKADFAEFDKRFAEVKVAVHDTQKAEDKAKLLALEAEDAKQTQAALQHMEDDISHLPS